MQTHRREERKRHGITDLCETELRHIGVHCVSWQRATGQSRQAPPPSLGRSPLKSPVLPKGGDVAHCNAMACLLVSLTKKGKGVSHSTASQLEERTLWCGAALTVQAEHLEKMDGPRELVCFGIRLASKNRDSENCSNTNGTRGSGQRGRRNVGINTYFSDRAGVEAFG